MKNGRKHLFTPGPVEVDPRVLEESSRPMMSHRGGEFQELYTRTTGLLEEFLSPKGQAMALLIPGSGTTAVDSMVMSLLSPRDRVLIPVWGEFGERLAQTVALTGAETIVKEYPPGTAPPSDEILDYVERYKATAVALVHNETGTGLAYRELKRLAERMSGARLLVDSVSGFAGEELSLDWGIEAVATCTHKAIWAPPGLGIVALSPTAVERLERESPLSAPPSINLAKYVKFKREKRETPFTPPIGIVRSLLKALELIVEEGGIGARVKEHARRAEKLYSLEEEGVEPLVGEPGLRSNTVVALKTPEDATLVKKNLEQQGYVVAAGMGRLKKAIIRVGTMGAHSPQAIEGLVNALREALLGRQA